MSGHAFGKTDSLFTKVILNRRKDVAAWDRSFRSAILKTLRDNWSLKALSLFSPDYFWLRQITVRFVVDFFNGSFETHGVDVYRSHYRQLEDKLGEGKYLSWTVEDGWYVTPPSYLNTLSLCFRKPQPGLIVVKGPPMRLSGEIGTGKAFSEWQCTASICEAHCGENRTSV